MFVSKIEPNTMFRFFAAADLFRGTVNVSWCERESLFETKVEAHADPTVHRVKPVLAKPQCPKNKQRDLVRFFAVRTFLFG